MRNLSVVPSPASVSGDLTFRASVHLMFSSEAREHDDDGYLSQTIIISPALARSLAAELLAAADAAEPTPLRVRTCDSCGQPSGDSTLCPPCEEELSREASKATPADAAKGSSQGMEGAAPTGGQATDQHTVGSQDNTAPGAHEHRGELPENRGAGAGDDGARQEGVHVPRHAMTTEGDCVPWCRGCQWRTDNGKPLDWEASHG